MQNDDDLSNLSDAELNECFAVEVANIPHYFTIMKRGLYYRPNANGYTARIEEAWKVEEAIADQHVYPHDEPVTKHRLKRPPFSTDANAVLPWLEDCAVKAVRQCGEEGFPDEWMVDVFNGAPMGYGTATAPTFARAACIALIRAKRAAGMNARNLPADERSTHTGRSSESAWQ